MTSAPVAQVSDSSDAACRAASFDGSLRNEYFRGHHGESDAPILKEDES